MRGRRILRFPFSGNPAADSRRTGFGRSVPAEVFTGSAPKAGFLENGNGWLPLRLWRRVPVRHILRGSVSGQFRPSAHFPQPTLQSGPFFGDGRKRHEPLSLHFPFEIVRHICTAFRFSKKIFVPFMEINLRFESGLKRGLAALPRTLHRRPALFLAGEPWATDCRILSPIRAPEHRRRKPAQCGLKKKAHLNKARLLKFFASIPRGRPYAAHAGEPSLP